MRRENTYAGGRSMNRLRQSLSRQRRLSAGALLR